MSGIKVGRPGVMRDLNKNIILNIVRKKKVSKIELSRLSGLNPSTVTNVMGELLLEKKIEYCGKGENNKNGGPKPDMYKLNAQNHFFIGVDIFRKGIKGVVLDLEESIVAKDFIDARSYESPGISGAIVCLIENLLEKGGLTVDKIVAATISVAALVDTNGKKIIATNIPELRALDMGQICGALPGARIYMDNDINLLLTGYIFDKGSSPENALCVGIRSGIGLGIITNGKIVRGKSGMSGDLSHYYANGSKRCKCGNIGCFDTILGEDALVELLCGYLQNKEATIENLYEILSRGDARLISLIEKPFGQLAIFIGGLVQLFNPTHILIGGEIFNYCERLFDYIVSSSSGYYNAGSFERENFIKIHLEDETIARCAGKYAIDEYFRL